MREGGLCVGEGVQEEQQQGDQQQAVVLVRSVLVKIVLSAT